MSHCKGTRTPGGREPQMLNNLPSGPCCLSPQRPPPMLPTRCSPLCCLAPANHVGATSRPLSTRTLQGHLVNPNGYLPHGDRSPALPLGDVLEHKSRDSLHLSCLPSTHPPLQGPKCLGFCPHDSDGFRTFLLEGLYPHTRTARLPPLWPAEPGRWRKMLDKCPH